MDKSYSQQLQFDREQDHGHLHRLYSIVHLNANFNSFIIQVIIGGFHGLEMLFDKNLKMGFDLPQGRILLEFEFATESRNTKNEKKKELIEMNR